MEFRYESHPALPRLAWAAVIEPDSCTVRVLHGPGVETTPGFFVEGAWDGPFIEGRFDSCSTFAGTGGRLTADGVRFSSPNHNLERCHTLESGGVLRVSNSLALLVTLAGDELDPTWPWYYFDAIRAYRTGLRHARDSIRLRSGNRVLLHDCHNIDIRNARISARRLRDFGPRPTSFSGYLDSLLGVTGRVFANAADASRNVRYRPLASISRGYDSPATAALSAACGCREAIAFRRSRVTATGEYQDDSGTPIAEALGLECTEIDRVDLCKAPASLLKLHYPNPFGSIVSSMDQVSEQLRGALFVTGRHGEHFWSTDPSRSLPGYQEPTARKTLVQNTIEFRLDRGYIDFHLPYTGGVHAPDLLRISRSADMSPWRIGGDYDRPIARRIVEQAGVPRTLFGMQKMGGANPIPRLEQFSDAARDEFMGFFRDYAPSSIQRKLDGRPTGGFGFHEHGIARGMERWLRTRYGLRTISEYLLGFHDHQRRRSPYLYAYHWGFAAVARRYRDALAAGVSAPTPNDSGIQGKTP